MNNDLMGSEYKENGYCICKNIINQSYYEDIDKAICLLIKSAILRLSKSDQLAFERHHFNDKQLPHLGLIELYKLSPKHQQIVVVAC